MATLWLQTKNKNMAVSDILGFKGPLCTFKNKETKIRGFSKLKKNLQK